VSLSFAPGAPKFGLRMTPESALEAQIARYRTMSREERVAIALRLHDLACEMSRVGIRHQNPNASAAEVEKMLRERLELARTP
jgi:Rv0078B-related antitoxin